MQNISDSNRPIQKVVNIKNPLGKQKTSWRQNIRSQMKLYYGSENRFVTYNVTYLLSQCYVSFVVYNVTYHLSLTMLQLLFFFITFSVTIESEQSHSPIQNEKKSHFTINIENYKPFNVPA